MRRHKYKKGFEYSVGDEIEYGVIIGIWPHPNRKSLRIFFVSNTGRYHGTYTFYTIENQHYVGPTLNRFVPHAIVLEAYSLLSGEQLPPVVSEQRYSAADVPHPSKIPETPKQQYVADIPDNAEEIVKSKPTITETKETAKAPKPSPIKKKRRIPPPIGGLQIKRKAKDG